MGKYIVSAYFKNGALTSVVYSYWKRVFHLAVGSLEEKIRCLAKEMRIQGLSITGQSF